MKIIITAMLFFISIAIPPQRGYKDQIENLNKTKQRLESIIKVKQDSLILKDQQIDRFTQEDLFSKLKVQSEGMAFKATLSISGKIRKENDPNSIILTIVNKNDTVLLTDYIGEYWIVNKGPYFGYINDIFICKTTEFQTFKDAITKRCGRMAVKIEDLYTEKEKETIKKLDQEKKDRLIEKFGKENGEKINSGHYWIGMTKDMSIESLGNPETVNSSVGSWGINEQWVYYSLYLYFDNGVLTSYQSSGI